MALPLPRNLSIEPGLILLIWYFRMAGLPIYPLYCGLRASTVVLLISPDEYCENVTSTLVRVLPLIATLEPRTSFFKGLHTDERRDQF